MSRLDWFTIAVVLICITAIGFLLLKTNSLLNNEDSIMTDPTTEVLDDLDPDLSEDDVYTDETIEPDNFDEDEDSNESDAKGNSDLISEKGGTSGNNTGKTDDSDTNSDNADIEAEPKEEPARINTSPSGGSGGNFMVVAGSFAQMINAENMVRDLQKKGFAGAEIGKFNAGKYATALAGRFDSQAEAQSLIADLKAKGIEAYMQKRK